MDLFKRPRALKLEFLDDQGQSFRLPRRGGLHCRFRALRIPHGFAVELLEERVELPVASAFLPETLPHEEIAVDEGPEERLHLALQAITDGVPRQVVVEVRLRVVERGHGGPEVLD